MGHVTAALSVRERPASAGALRTTPLRAAAPALLGYAAVRALGVLAVIGWGAHERTGSGLRRLATLWDAAWYQGIALHGYAGTAAVPGPHGPYQPYAFFPLYPLAIRALAWLLPVGVAALAVAWAASLAAAWGIFAVAEHCYGRRAGVLAAVLWGLLPYAVIESAAYSEALFTAFAAWAVYAVLVRRWALAGALALLAGLTRPTGVALALAVAAVAGWELLHRRGGASALLAPLGFAGFLGWVGLAKGRWDGYFRVQDAWQSRFDFGYSTYRALRSLLTRTDGVWLVDGVVIAVLVGSLLLLVISVSQRQPPVLLLYSAAVVVLALGDAAYFDSRARFLLPAFGLLLPAANGLARVRSRGSLLAVLVTAALVSAVLGAHVVYVVPDAP